MTTAPEILKFEYDESFLRLLRDQFQKGSHLYESLTPAIEDAQTFGTSAIELEDLSQQEKDRLCVEIADLVDFPR